MKYRIAYDTPGRLRLRCGGGVFSEKQELSLETMLADIPGVISANASYVNGGILVMYSGNIKEDILKAISSVNPLSLESLPLTASQIVDREFKNDFTAIIKDRIITKFFVPQFIRIPLTVIRALPFVKKGLSSILNGKLNVDVLDAVSISVSILNGSYSTASSVMTLLNISSLLEGYTRRKAKNALSDSLALNIDKVWIVKDGCEQSIPLVDVAIGDVLRVRQGSMIPVDGKVVGGTAGVNEASMTGESETLLKSDGMSVYAGTVVEEGAIDIETTKMPDDSRIQKIIELIENSDTLKSGVQTRAEAFADGLVPFSFLASAAAYALTGNVSKALSALMVDYSCAIKLSTSICIISAMREATNYNIMVKGGRFLENYAFADTIVFDKTGTLTVSCPSLSKVVAFDGYDENEILRIAACLEEHFPHSVAKSIVCAAQEKGLEHQEEHAEVKYIVAHGIASDLNGKKAVIGSAHFVFDDEQIPLKEGQREIIEDLSKKYSMIYLAIGGSLCGILCIEDPIRKDAGKAIELLKDEGIENVLMITGDGESTAANVCKKLGIEKFYAKVLPEDKLRILNSIKSENHKVIMVGDGINDTPALAAADVSVAMKDASDIAREVADVTLLSSDLFRLVVLRQISESLFKRIHSNYRFIAFFNSALLFSGMCGFISPITSAVAHNLSTMCLCVSSMRTLLDREKEDAILD